MRCTQLVFLALLAAVVSARRSKGVDKTAPSVVVDNNGGNSVRRVMDRNDAEEGSWIAPLDAPTDGPRDPPCYWSMQSLSAELEAEVVRGKPVVEASDLKPLSLAHFPYSNQYCIEANANRFLDLRPKGCSMDAFDPEAFLETFRGRRLILWGDSVMRQFFMYLIARLRGHVAKPTKLYADPYYPKVGHGCALRDKPDSDGVRLTPQCFSAVGDWSDKCGKYHDGATALCFVRTERHVVDDANVAFFNGIAPSDILLVNIGLHCNRQSTFMKYFRDFAALLSHQRRQGRHLPLVLWRDTSPQHFKQGAGGNFPTKLHSELRQVDPDQYRCETFTHDEMRAGNWRNQQLMTTGLSLFQEHNLTIPVMRIWNVSSLLPGKHPQVLGHSSIADCTHWCPNLGGIYEVWSQIFLNFLAGAMKHEGLLRAASHSAIVGSPHPTVTPPSAARAGSAVSKADEV